MYIHLGLDDIDSRLGGCTTYVASLIVEMLLKDGAIFYDYPNLVRLNPNIPYKTKGNAAVALRFVADDPKIIFQRIFRLVSEYAELGSGGANPGVVMLLSHKVPEDVKTLAQSALSDFVSRKKALRIIEDHGMLYNGLGNKMGIVGALAAIGNTLEEDHTFELLAYRDRSFWGSRRRVDRESIVLMDKKTFPYTFNNIDYESGRLLVTPHGPDPVLFGIRGESAKAVLDAFKMIRVEEPIERYLIYRSNQGTAVHLQRTLKLNRLKAYTSGRIVGYISERPFIDIGGHVYFKIKDESGEARCGVYEPAADLRKVVLKLLPGDRVELGGGIRKATSKHPKIINVEYVKILELTRSYRQSNPICQRCGRRMVSDGRQKGFKCTHCSYKDKNAEKIFKEYSRDIVKGLYLPPPRSHRHLTKPPQRFGLEKIWRGDDLIEEWFKIYSRSIKS